MNVRMIGIAAGLATATIAAAQTPPGVDPSRMVLPPGARVPAWATPQTSPRSEAIIRSSGTQATAAVAVAIELPTLPAPATDPRLARGAVLKGPDGVPVGTIVSADSQNAIILVGQNKIQVPANAITGSDAFPPTTFTPALVQSWIDASTQNQRSNETPLKTQ